MAADELTPLQIALRLLEKAHANGVPNALETVEAVLPSLGISPGSEEHFLLVYHNQQHLHLHDGHPLPGPLAFSNRFPQWKGRAEQMIRLEESLHTIRHVCGDLIRSTLENQGWKLIRPLKEGERRRIDLARQAKEEAPQVVKAAVGMDCFHSLKREFLLGRRLPASAFVPSNGFGVLGEVSWFTMDFADAGTLAQAETLVADARSPAFRKQVWVWWKESARALSLLHRLDLCHNDLKASNILLDTRGRGRIRARIGDLQLVGKAGKPVARKTDPWDHPGQRENFLAHRADDVYRLGMTMLWLLEPQVADGHFLENGRRLRLAGLQPEPFRGPLVACLRDRRAERVDNGMELCRVLAGVKA